MSKVTANAARRFVTAYSASGKSSIAMVHACIDMLTDGTEGKSLVSAVRGAYESAHGAFPTTADAKKFETLVSQRSYAATLVRTVGEDSDVTIRAALRVASGALPRAATLKLAEAANSAADFDAAITAALKAKKGPARDPQNAGGNGSKLDAENNTPTAPAVTPIGLAGYGFGDILAELNNRIAAEGDAKKRAAMVKALKVVLLKVSTAETVKA